MPVIERYPYVTEQAYRSKSASAYRPSKKAINDVPSALLFDDPAVLLNFVSSLSSPDQLLNVTSLRVQFNFACDRRQSAHHNIVTGISILVRHCSSLQVLSLYWEGLPSSVLSGASFSLSTFQSWMVVDVNTINFLNSQPELRTLDLKEWGRHLPPRHPGSTASSSSAVRRRAMAPEPPSLAPGALPNLVEFSGHAEVASQLAAGRPLQVVTLSEGFDAGTTGEEWREIMAGLGQSTHWVSNLSVATLETFSLEMLAEIGRHLHALETLRLRVHRAPYVSELFHWDHWKNYVLPLVELEHIEIELVEDWRMQSQTLTAHPVACNLPTIDHIRQWHRTCPMLLSASVRISGGPKLIHWEWRNLSWIDRLRQR
ncbi:hypothetical protein BS47DRAFT_338430 [Hydnum rufescens UP504]|uniref:Uncharacterized protein n=1 Tax=Hydnum rufescens UP504 TaxID=1448309 RepID=A0A9P6AJW1_9AGAM|nr:hypothetical protein BS47DRAFT_338430 [Hydnum rufescens UP504]